MPTKGRAHFDEYPPQTQAKHAILDKYFRAYLQALSRHVDAFHYVDGFAGRGSYGVGQPGSPLLAISALAEQRKRATVSLVESDAATFRELQESVSGRLAGLVEPILVNDEFSNVIAAVCARPIYRRFNAVATFAFVDPCGVNGVRLDDVRRLLSLRFSECLLFWNYDGLNRWIGAVAKGSHAPGGLRDFFGGEQGFQLALACFRSALDAPRKEVELRDIYVGALNQQAGARYILPFRFEARDRSRASHYLVHCSNHPLAFRIMKEVMSQAANDGSDAGSFQFLQASELGGQTAMFRPALEDARDAVVRELSAGERRVSVFTREWVSRPGDYLIERQYRDVLLALEADGAIEMFDPRTNSLAPASLRRKMRGKPTLAPDLIVRLRP